MAGLVWKLVPQSTGGCSPMPTPQGLALELTSSPTASSSVPCIDSLCSSAACEQGEVQSTVLLSCHVPTALVAFLALHRVPHQDPGPRPLLPQDVPSPHSFTKPGRDPVLGTLLQPGEMEGGSGKGTVHPTVLSRPCPHQPGPAFTPPFPTPVKSKVLGEWQQPMKTVWIEL